MKFLMKFEGFNSYDDEPLTNTERQFGKQTKKFNERYNKGDIMTVGELKALKTGDYIHLEYYNDEGSRVCNSFKKLNIINGYIDAEAYPIPIERYSDDTPIQNLDNSGYTFTVRYANVI